MKCEVINDMLPLYVDGVCSAETRKLVEEHVCNCEACKSLLEVLQEDEKENDATTEKNAFQAFDRKNKKRNRAKVIVSTIVVLVILLTVGYACYVPEKLIQYSDGMVTVTAAEDGVIEVYMNKSYKNMYANYSVDDNGEMTVYVSGANNVLSSIGVMNSGKDINGMALVIGNALCVGYGNTGNEQRQFDNPNGEMLKSIKAIYYVNASKDEIEQAVTDRENGIHNHPVTDQEFLESASLVWSR